MTPLEDELVDLGAHLAHGDGDELAASVRARLGAQRFAHRNSVPLWAKVAAAVLLAVALALALPPSRRAIARLFGIGAVGVRTVPTTVLGPGTTSPPASTVPGAVEPVAVEPAAAGATDIADAERRVTFRVRLVGDPAAGPLRRVDVDERVPGGLVALTYDRFTVVELASAAEAFPVMRKLVPPGVTVEPTTVDGRDALWIEGAHEIAYVAPDDSVRQDTVRRAGPVLVWARDGVTFRVEGLTDLDDARRVAASIR